LLHGSVSAKANSLPWGRAGVGIVGDAKSQATDIRFGRSCNLKYRVPGRVSYQRTRSGGPCRVITPRLRLRLRHRSCLLTKGLIRSNLIPAACTAWTPGLARYAGSPGGIRMKGGLWWVACSLWWVCQRQRNFGFLYSMDPESSSGQAPGSHLLRGSARGYEKKQEVGGGVGEVGFLKGAGLLNQPPPLPTPTAGGKALCGSLR